MQYTISTWSLRHLIASWLAIVCLWSSCGTATATDNAVEDQINMAIQHFAKQLLAADSVEINSLDPRLRLTACAEIPAVALPKGARESGKTTVEVTCSGQNQWKIYVPVHIVRYGQVVMTKKPLPRGSTVGAGDVYLHKVDLSRQLQGYYTDLNQVIGMQVKRPLRHARVVTPAMLKPRHLVKRGDSITILAEVSGLTVRVKGKAAMDGYQGQSIKVKNERSERLLQAEVIGPGLVRVRL